MLIFFLSNLNRYYFNIFIHIYIYMYEYDKQNFIKYISILFNFTILFCLQFFCLMTFVIPSYASEKYRNKEGKIYI